MTPPAGEARERLREAAEWRLIGLLFERPRAGWLAEVKALAGEVSEEALKQAALAAEEAEEGFYLRMLGPGGIASPRESAYRGRQDPGAILAALRAFYEAFAYAPAAEDPPDHVAVEASFVGYLRLKEAFGLANGLAEQARLTSEAAATFLNDHLRALAEPLRDRLLERGPLYLILAAEALLVRTGPPEQEVLMECDVTDRAACGVAGCALEPEADDPAQVFGEPRQSAP